MLSQCLSWPLRQWESVWRGKKRLFHPMLMLLLLPLSVFRFTFLPLLRVFGPLNCCFLLSQSPTKINQSDNKIKERFPLNRLKWGFLFDGFNIFQKNQFISFNCVVSFQISCRYHILNENKRQELVVENGSRGTVESRFPILITLATAIFWDPKITWRPYMRRQCRTDRVFE